MFDRCAVLPQRVMLEIRKVVGRPRVVVRAIRRNVGFERGDVRLDLLELVRREVQVRRDGVGARRRSRSMVMRDGTGVMRQRMRDWRGVANEGRRRRRSGERVLRLHETGYAQVWHAGVEDNVALRYVMLKGGRDGVVEFGWSGRRRRE